jgi:hypothetical protein
VGVECVGVAEVGSGRTRGNTAARGASGGAGGAACLLLPPPGRASQVLDLLALLAEEYKYCRQYNQGRIANAAVNLLVSLVQEYK